MSESKRSLNEALHMFHGIHDVRQRHRDGWAEMTKGICYMKDTYQLNWLIDAIAFHSRRLQHDFIDWKLNRKGDSLKFDLIATNKRLYEEFTVISDLAYDTVEVWVRDQIIMLPSEY